jgi:long-chain acyl-CoA synthetase
MSEHALSIHDATAQMTAEGQIFEIETVDIRGIATKAWKHAPKSLKAVLDLSLNHADKDFIVYEDERYSFAEHYRYAATIAHRLADYGVQPGDRVAIAARNLPEWAFTFWGTMAAGAISVPLNAWWTGEELAYGLRDSATKIVLVDEDRLERIRPHLDELDFLTHVVVVSEHRGIEPRLGATHDRVTIMSAQSFIGDVAADVVAPDVDINPDDDATIFYTSGTTGSPKGVVGTHRNAVTNIMNLFFVGQRSTLRFGGGNVDANGQSIQNSYLLTIPLFHATGCLAVMTVNLASGGKLVMVHHFDAGQALALIERERITTFGGVPTIAMQILDHPDFATFDTSSVRSVSYGGAPSPPELVRRIREAFPVGQPGNGYGLTETSAAVALNSGPDYVAKPTSCGPAIPVNDVAIVPEDFTGLEPTDDLPQGPDVTGELWIKGPNVVRGYWNKPEATAATFTNGWLHSGDVARIDEDGFIHIVDRAKDMIIRGGENIFCTEVEAALFEHPDVADCAVIGVPHPVLGEEVGAVIVLRPGRKVDPDDLITHAAHRLSKYMVPVHVYFRSEPLPRNPAGKVLKRQLRDEVTRPN